MHRFTGDILNNLILRPEFTLPTVASRHRLVETESAAMQFSYRRKLMTEHRLQQHVATEANGTQHLRMTPQG